MIRVSRVRRDGDAIEKRIWCKEEIDLNIH